MPDPLIRQFETIGARLAVARDARLARRYDLNIDRDRRGEYYRLRVRDTLEGFRVLQTNAATRHLLLLAPSDDVRRSPVTRRLFADLAPLNARPRAVRLLCGHDERHWFVSPISERVSTIAAAKRALLPPSLRDTGLTPSDLDRRRTAQYVRQGEWFFAWTDRSFDKTVVIHRNEPLVRGNGGKPHVVSELVRFGGVPVLLAHGREYTEAEWAQAVAANPRLAQERHQRFVKDPEVYARGTVRHADHATVDLGNRWHRVLLNGEIVASGVSFYD